ncbi:hypothetical protein EJD97_025726 [Solanum chilense]|uniref:Uncharacterized protein n=1 Tax=Solanum chilense TaxID=4083 RepID=A0A6N2APB3_SOLCI|nr:hypothetical protein EJD97_025726 [Solanum chilense]
MNTRNNAARRLEEEIANDRDPPHDEQVPPLEEDANVKKAPAKPRPMTADEITAIVGQMAQAMTTQAQAAMVQAQAMTTHDNQDIAPRPHQQVTTMASRLRDFS